MISITNVRKKTLKKGEIIPLTFDYVFTRVFNNESNIEIVESLVACILNISLKEIRGNIKILSSLLPIESKKEQDSKVDLLLDYKKEKINIELNNEGVSTGVIDRNVSYACKVHGKQLKYGIKNYNKINKTIQICLNTKIRNEEDIIEVYYIINQKSKKILTEKLEIIYVDMVKGVKLCYNKPIDMWCKIITTKEEEKFKQLIKQLGDEVMSKKAKEKLTKEVDKYSRDDEAVRVYTKLTHEEILRNGELETVKEESFNSGYNIGEQYGMREAKIELARNMVAKDMPIEDIIDITNLSIEDILPLQEENHKKAA